jgi:hypothetical protein
VPILPRRRPTAPSLNIAFRGFTIPWKPTVQLAAEQVADSLGVKINLVWANGKQTDDLDAEILATGLPQPTSPTVVVPLTLPALPTHTSLNDIRTAISTAIFAIN